MKDSVREQLSQMRQKARNSQEDAASFVVQKQMITEALQSDDPKTRKNAALLLGVIPWEKKDEIAKLLFASYEKEETLYVRPAYLKGMEDLSQPLSEEMKEQLEKRKDELVRCDMGEEEKKHLSEELRILYELLQGPLREHDFKGITGKVPLLLTTEKEYLPYLMNELKRRGVPTADIRRTPFGIRVMTEDVDPILKARLYDKIYFIVPIRRGEKLYAETLKETLMGSMLSDLLGQYLDGEAPIPFRVNAIWADEDLQEKHRFMKKAAEVLEDISGKRLYNAPGNYEIEILFGQREDKSFGLYLWLKALKDHRFSYRLQSKATSMSCHRAATMMEMLYPYLKEDAMCLDPLCGTGTLLIERGKIKGSYRLFGTEVYPTSIQAAKENAASAEIPIHFIQRDYFSFTHDGKFDEILTEFPDLFHKEKEEKITFLRSFFKKSMELTKSGSVWGMLTGERNLMKQQIRMTRGITLVEEIPFGGHRTLYICRRK